MADTENDIQQPAGGLPVATPQYTASVQAKAPTSKKGISYPGTLPMDPNQTAELLVRMQDMLDQRTSPWQNFMSSMQDTMAMVTPPRLGGPTEAMAKRAQVKNQEMEDILGLQTNISSMKAAQKLAQSQQDAANQFISGGGAGVTGGTGGGASFNDLPAASQQRILQAAKSNPAIVPDLIDQELKALGGFQGKAQYDAASNTPQNYWVEGYGNISMTPNQLRALPKEIRDKIEMATFKKFGYTPSAPTQASPTQGLQAAAKGAPELYKAEGIAKELGIPIISGYRSAEKQAEIEANKKPGQLVAKPGYSQHQHGNAIDVQWDKLTPEQQKLALQYFDRPFVNKNDPGHLVLKGAQPVTAPVQVAGPAQVPSQVAPAARTQAAASPMPQEKDYPSKATFDAALSNWQKQQEQNISTAAKSGEESRKKAGDAVAALEQNAEKAAEVIRTADRVINHATKYKNEFGYGYQQENPVLAAAANIPGVGAIVEKAVPAIAGAPGESARRAQTDTDASKLGLDFAAQMFAGTGARLGVGLEQMAANAKGVGTNLPAATNALNANLVKVAAEKARDQAAAWSKWKEAHGGENADPYGFMHSDINKNIIEKYDRKLDSFEEEAKKIYPEFFGEKKATNKANRKPLGQILGGQ